MKRLNGWLRLWIVTTALYGAGVFGALFAWILPDIQPRLTLATIEFVDSRTLAALRDSLATIEGTSGATVTNAKATLEPTDGLPDSQTLDLFSGVAHPGVSILDGVRVPQRIDTQERIRIAEGLIAGARAEAAAAKKQMATRAAMLWALPSLGVLIFGYAVAWVVNGFKGPPSTV